MKKNTNKKVDIEISKDKTLQPLMSMITEWYDRPGKEPKTSVPDHIMQKICDELLDWAYHDPEARVIGNFFRKNKIRIDTYERWKQDYPIFKDAYYEALEAIGDRREDGALIRQYDNTTWAKTARRYNGWQNKQWHADQEFVAKLKLDNESNETKYIIIKDFPDAKSE